MIKKEFAFLLIVTCAVVLFWVVTNILHDRSNVTLPPELQKAMQPISPNFNQETLDEIGKLNTQ